MKQITGALLTIINHWVMEVESASDALEGMASLVERIKSKYQHMVSVDTAVNEVLLTLINNVTLIGNLSKDAFSFIFFETEAQRSKAFHIMGYLKEHAPQLLKNKVNVNWYIKTLQLILQLLEQIHEADLKQISLITFLGQKLKLFLIIYRFAITFDCDDIFSQPKTHTKWKELSGFITFKVLAPQKDILASVQSFRKSVKTATAILEEVSKSQTQRSKLVSYIFGGIHYFLSESEADKKSIEFKSSMAIEKVRSMVNFFEDGFSKYLMKITLPLISYKDKIYVPYAYRGYTKEAVTRWIKGGYTKLQLTEPRDKIEANDKELFNKNPSKVCVRVLCHQNLTKMNDKKKFSRVLLHIHGGGFIGFSSRSHQFYTRKWCKEQKIPIFSVDYRKAPETPYPGPLDDCWQVYNWILTESHKYFNISPNKQIILAGDSAGGNMIMGITNLCVQLGIQRPKAILAFYPALNLKMHTFTPSLMHSFDDPLLSFQFLFLCLSSYIQGPEFDPSLDYYLSPIYTPNQHLKQFPPIRIFAGQMDPLYDDSVRFAIQLKNNEVDVKMVSYANMIHGYLQLDVPGGVKYASQCVGDSTQAIKQFQ